MYGQRVTEAQKSRALQELRNKGVVKVEIAFSGGNDEGGAESFHAYDTEGNEVTIGEANAYKDYRSEKWTVYEYDRQTGGRIQRDATPDEIVLASIREVLEEPIYDRYGSFAGEFYVDGTLTWDVLAGTNKMRGQEELRHWEEFEV